MLAAIIAVVAIILDQLTKYFVVDSLELYGSSEFIPSILSFYHTRNTGAAFSMLSDQRWVYMVLSIISMGIILYLLIKEYKRHPLMNISLAMILGGGIGNMIDRIRLEYVVDFLKVEFVDFAIFNIADCFVTVGAILLGVYIIFIEPKIYKREQAEKAALAEVAASEGSPEPVSEETPVCEETVSEASEVNSENE